MSTEIAQPGLTEGQLRNHGLERLAEKRANADPLPGPLADAFTNGPIKVGKWSVRQLVAYDWTIMKAINSPLYQQMLEADKPEGEQSDTDFTDLQGYEICWQFTRPIGDVDAVFTKGGHVGVSIASKNAMAFECQPYEIADIINAVTRQVTNAFATALKYKADKEKDGDTTFFRDSEKPPATG